MTSPKFSKSKIDSKDFIRSILDTSPFALLSAVFACLTSILPIASYVSSVDFKKSTNVKEEIISFFGGSEYSGNLLSMNLLHIALMLCGIFAAFSLFKFVFKKSSVNVMFSVGLTRSRLFFNRIFGGLITFFLAAFIPWTIAMFMNIIHFGSHSHIFEVYLYEMLAHFLPSMVGFSIASLCIVNSGCFAEGLLSTFAFSFLPGLARGISDTLSQSFLKGYLNTDSYSLIASTQKGVYSPWKFLVNLTGDINPSEAMENALTQGPVSTLASLTTGKTVAEDKALTFGIILPLIIWFAVAVVILALTGIILNRRKTENSNSFGKFFLSSASIGVCVCLIAVYAITFIISQLTLTADYYSDMYTKFYSKLILIIAGIALGVIFLFFIAELIIKRKFKKTLRILPVGVAVALLFVLTFVYNTTGHFGSYIKTPDSAKVKNVVMSFEDPAELFNITPVMTSDTEAGSKAEDIELANKLYDIVKQQNYTGEAPVGTVTFRFKLKNDKFMYRSFKIYSTEVMDDYNKQIFESSYLKDYMKKVLTGEYIPSEDNTNIDNSNSVSPLLRPGDSTKVSGFYPAQQWSFLGKDYVFDGFNYENHTAEVLTTIDDPAGLMQAVYNDISKMNFDDFYKNNSKPIGVLAYQFEKAENINDSKNTDLYYDETTNQYFEKQSGAGDIVVGSHNVRGFYLYPQMTETINYLKENGYDPAAFGANVKEVYYADIKLNVSDAYSQQAKLSNPDYYSYSPITMSESSVKYNTFVSTDYIGSNIFNDNFYNGNKTVTVFETLKSAHSQIGHPLQVVDDPIKAESIVNSSVPFYFTRNNNGRFIYIVYTDGTLKTAYVPEANLSALNK